MTPNLPQIIREVANHYVISVRDLKGSRRHRHIAHPRQIVYQIARDLTSSSHQTIGDALGYRDPSTIIAGLKAVKRRNDPMEAMAIREITREIHRQNEQRRGAGNFEPGPTRKVTIHNAAQAAR